jgi:hypothetical protein
MQTYGHELADAHSWCKKYKETRRDADLQQAWDLYYHIFRRINKYLPTVTTLDLRNVSHILARERDLELAVPGTYIAGAPIVHIARFASKLAVRVTPSLPHVLLIVHAMTHTLEPYSTALVALCLLFAFRAVHLLRVALHAPAPCRSSTASNAPAS